MSIRSAEIEPAIQAIQWLQAYALDSIGSGDRAYVTLYILKK
jgi:hypothetical protein